MTLRVAVDFGTSSTCVVASVRGREPQVVVMDGQPLLPSAVYAAPDGTLFVGQEAERQAAVDPSRFEPNPKRRIDEGELLLGTSVFTVVTVVHAVLARAVSETRRVAGEAEIDLLVVTHPADWGAVRTRLLRQAAGQLAHEVALVPEPVAAAVYHAATFTRPEVARNHTADAGGTTGDTVAVLDLGGGTVDASVVRRVPGADRVGFEVLATRGDPGFGGADIDQALLEYVGSLVSGVDSEAWQQLVRGRELADRRRRRVLRHDVRNAKETLSRHAYTDVPMPPPFADAHVTREDLERLVSAPLGRAADLIVSTIEAAGLRPQQLTAIFLVGGSSRIPLVSRLVHERAGVVPTTLDQPETVVARGALRAVQLLPDRTGAVPGAANVRHAEHVQRRAETVARPSPTTAPGARPAAPGAAGSGPGPGPSGTPQHLVGTPQHLVGAAPPVPPGAAGPGSVSPPYGGPAMGPHAAGPAPVPGARRNRRVLWSVVAALIVLAAAATTVVVTLEDSEAEGRTYAQYSYRFVAPENWVQTAHNVADRQVIIKPRDAQSRTDDDLVVVEEFVLNYDGGAQRARLARELRRMAGEDPGSYSDFVADHVYAGREVIYYRQHKPAASVDWYVLANGTAQVSVGCQVARTPRRVASACEQVVRTLEFTN